MRFNFSAYEKRLPELAESYTKADVFPHIVLDDFLEIGCLRDAVKDFPLLGGKDWIHYQHINENKGGLNKRHAIPPSLLAIIDALNAPDFVAWLSRLTGIAGLRADPDLEGGGLHQINPGGFLNIHADFTVHPHKKFWRRRVNLLLYLNVDWRDDFGGKLELWTKDMRQCFEAIAPIFNRCVIFNTDRDSFHGHPEPLACPPGMTRKSIALYYFTEERDAPQKIATNYRARPGDGFAAILIYLDKQALAFYNRLKGWLGLDDRYVSAILKWIARFRSK